MKSDPIIEINGLTKRFGSIDAVSGLCLQINRGEIFGLLGPNGAGKTTTIRVLLGLEDSTAGMVRIAGIDVGSGSHQLKRKIGWVPQSTSSDPLLTGREQLQMMAELYGIERPEARVVEVLAQFGIADARNRRISTYSGGMQKRLELATGTLQRPDLLILDEPTAGLDVQTRHQIWDMVRTLNTAGTTVLITTHYLDEADVLCDRVAIIDRGVLRAIGEPATLKSQYGDPKLRLTWNQPYAFQAALDASRELQGVTPGGQDAQYLLLTGTDRVGLLELLMTQMRQRNIALPDSVESESRSLDQVFASVTGREFDPVTGNAISGHAAIVQVDGHAGADGDVIEPPAIDADAAVGNPAAETVEEVGLQESTDMFGTFARNNLTFLKRWWWRLQRDRFTLGLALLQPALWLVLFGSLWENVIDEEWTGGGYLQFVTAGAVMMTVFNFGLMAGLEVIVDRERGALDRLIAAPVFPLSLVTSRVLFVGGIGTAQTLVIIVVATLMGVQFQSGFIGIAGLLVLASLLGAGIAASSISLGFIVANHGQFYTVTGLVALPMILISTVFAPLEAMPDWLAGLARANPMSYAVDGARSMVLGGSEFASYLKNTGVLVAFIAAVLTAGAAFGRRQLSIGR